MVLLGPHVVHQHLGEGRSNLDRSRREGGVRDGSMRSKNRVAGEGRRRSKKRRRDEEEEPSPHKVSSQTPGEFCCNQPS